MSEHLLQTLFVLGAVDGKIDESEQTMIDCLRMTVPHLQVTKAPERIGRAELLEKLSQLDALSARRQCYVLAVEMALASGSINDSERQYLALVQQALRLDDDFAKRAREIIGAKYQR
jgi:uncharacterized membrane protein YebE (DUF533 family)